MLRATRSRAAASVGAALIVIAGTAVLSAAPASATVSNCTTGSDLSLNRISFTCTEDQPVGWYLELLCAGPTHDVIHKGTLVYGPGTGTSMATCPLNEDIDGASTVEL
jgi:hypothetical protein